MKCPHCDHENLPDAKRCQRCQTLLGMGLEGATVIETPTVSGATAGPASTGGAPTGWSVPPGTPAEGSPGLSGLQSGALLGGRYEILQLLGEGGMGAVYKARDVELDRVVAVKVIRPELVGRAEILQRFKQELILARKVTHKNVIRIFDLGQAGNIKFITMEFVEGSDLKQVLRAKGKLETKEAVEVMLQTARALEAAHAEGVIHRDLKPQNIMIEQGTGRVLVMDFGIARSMESQGMTQTGALMGTPEYMSPEQAKGEKLDHRSDLFTFGIIFYELLTGRSPYKSDTMMGSLMKRLQEAARPPIEADASVPQDLSDLVGKCLLREAAERCQSAHEIVRALEDRMGLTPSRTIVGPAPASVAVSARHWRWAAAGLAVLFLAVLGWFVFQQGTITRPATQQKLITLLVADFSNTTGEPVFNGTLEPTLITALEGATFINVHDRGEARRTAEKLQPGTTKIDEPVARLVAQRQGIGVVVSGSISREGGGYRVSVRAIDAFTGKTIATQQIEGVNKDGVLGAAAKLAARVRKALGDDTPESLQLAAAETFTAASVEAAHAYAVAKQFEGMGKADEAIRNYVQAVELDPSLGRAYANLAAIHVNLGQREAAEKYYQLAVAKIDRMNDREKYKTRGIHFLMNRNHQKAIEELNGLVKQYPADSAGLKNLALAYFYRRDLPRALEVGRQALAIYPKNVTGRSNVALYAMYAGEFETAAGEARAVLEMNPSWELAYVALAMSELAQGRLAQAAEVYRRLEKVSAPGASYASSGLADLALYEGRLADATALLENGVTADLANSNPTIAANKFVTLAFVQLLRGQRAQALVAAERALSWSKEEGVLFAAARFYLQAAQETKARDLASKLAARFEPDPQAYAKLIEGEALLKRGSAREAVRLFQEAQKLADTWIGRFLLARAFLEAGAFTEASSELELCLKRRGEATAVFLDDIASYHYLPPVYYYLARAQEGLKSPGAAESYKTFLSIKEKADPDRLVEDARRRLTGR